MERSHFFFSIFVGMVLVLAGALITSKDNVGLSLMGLGVALVGITMLNRFTLNRDESEAPVVNLPIQAQR